MKVSTIYVKEPLVKHLNHDLIKTKELEKSGLTKRMRNRRKIFPTFAGEKKKRSRLEEGAYLYDELRPIIQRFLLIGVLPIQRLANGKVSAKLFSLATLYCVCIYFLSLPLLLSTGRDMGLHILNSDTFDEILMAQLFTVIQIPYLFTPVSFWLDANHIAKYFNEWECFQNDHLLVTKHRLRLGYKRRLSWIMTATVFAAILPVVAMSLLPPYLTMWQAPAIYFNCMLLFVPQLAYWHYNCSALVEAGRSIALCFKADVEANCRCHLIGDYKHLYLKLIRLLTDFGHSVYRVYGINFLVAFWIVTSSLYGSMASLFAGNYVTCRVLVSFTVCVGIPFFLKCNAAHWAPIHVKHDIEKELHYLTTVITDPESLEEMRSFLRATSSNKPSISLGGYVTVNRQMCQAVTATLVTYLIVLLQFQLSLPVTVANNNGTNLTIESS